MVPPYHNIVCELYQNSLFWFQKSVYWCSWENQHICPGGTMSWAHCVHTRANYWAHTVKHKCLLNYLAFSKFCWFLLTWWWYSQILHLIPIADILARNDYLDLLPKTYLLPQLDLDNSLQNIMVHLTPYAHIYFCGWDKNQYWTAPEVFCQYDPLVVEGFFTSFLKKN